MKNVLLCALAFAFCGAKASTFNVENISEFNNIIKSVQPGDSGENGAYPPTQNGLIHPQLLLKWP